MKNSIKSQLLIVICSLSFGIPGSLLASKEEKEEAEVIQAQSRALLIFLDDTETEAGYVDPKYEVYVASVGTVTQKAALAIIERTGPILVSGSLLYNLFKDRDKNFTNEKFQERVQHCDMGDWFIKKITNKNISDADATEKDTPLFLLINKRNVAIAQYSRYWDVLEKDNAKITELEFSIGLKMNHLEPVEAKNNEEFRDYITKLYVPKEKSRWQFADNTGKNFMVVFPSLFITKKEYRAAKKQMPDWVIYLEGHGDLNHSIASIALQVFPKLLNFFESQIKTKLFVYRACYAAGFNTKKVFADLTSPIGKTRTYSYAIITNALTDAPTTTPGIYYLDYLNPSVHYYSFLQEAEREEVNYAKAMSYISEAKKFIGNIPQIRLPGMEWFSVLEEEKTVVSIGNILAHSRNAPLDIEKYFKVKKDPRALLFYTRYVPFELIINAFPALIPMVQSDYNENIGIGSYYLIDHITTDFPNLRLIYSLKEIQLKNTTFIVKKITCKSTAAPNFRSVLENFVISYSSTYGVAPSISYTMISDAKGKEVIKEGPAIADVEGKIKQVTEELGKQFKIGESKVSPVKDAVAEKVKYVDL